MSDKILDLEKKPLIMGILNVTPDSFSDGRKYFNFDDAVQHAEHLLNSGVDIIDIGGESTRPGATPISEEEELNRVIPVIRQIAALRISHSTLPTLHSTFHTLHFLISIDTYKSNVARAALLAGANMINDVSGLTMDKDMVGVASEFQCPIVIMHNRGIPVKECRVQSAEYRVQSIEGGMEQTLVPCSTFSTPHSVLLTPHSSLLTVFAWLQKQTQYAISNGVKKENIIIDPGIGFGKTPEENLFIIENLKKFKSLDYPVLVGPSRKSFIKALFGEDVDIEEKTKELVDLSIKNGADIVRVHEVIESTIQL